MICEYFLHVCGKYIHNWAQTPQYDLLGKFSYVDIKNYLRNKKIIKQWNYDWIVSYVLCNTNVYTYK